MANNLQEKTVFFDDRAEYSGVLIDNCARLQVQPDAGYMGISKLYMATGWYTFYDLWMSNDVPSHLQGTGQEVALNYLYCSVSDILQYTYARLTHQVPPPSFTIEDELNFLIACTDPFCAIRPSFFIETYEKISWSTSHIAELPTEVRWRLTDVRLAQSDSCSWIFDTFSGHNLTAADCRIVLKFTANTIYSGTNDDMDQYDTPLTSTTAYFVSTINDPNYYYLIGMHTNSGVGGSRSRCWDADDTYLAPFAWGSPSLYFWIPPNE